MDKNYVKCILSKGFALIQEKETVAGQWFPRIIFFGTDGNILFSIIGDAKRKFYDALVMLNDPKRNLEDRQVFNFTELAKNYTFEWKTGWLHIFEVSSLKGKSEDSLIIIDSTNAKKILEAINNLV